MISERVNWVFEADIRRFYDSIDHEWLMRIVEHRIADPRIPRLMRQWLEAGVLENGVYAETVEGTPQGAGISPLLANIFLHDALDLWGRAGDAPRGDRPYEVGALCRRPLADLRAARGCGENGDSPAGTVGQVRSSPSRRQDAADRVRTVRCDEPSATARRAARGVRFPGLHALLRKDPGVRRETGEEHEVKDPMGVWIATGALSRVRSLNHPLWRRPC
jgi:hypothetical protein